MFSKTILWEVLLKTLPSKPRNSLSLGITCSRFHSFILLTLSSNLTCLDVYTKTFGDNSLKVGGWPSHLNIEAKYVKCAKLHTNFPYKSLYKPMCHNTSPYMVGVTWMQQDPIHLEWSMSIHINRARRAQASNNRNTLASHRQVSPLLWIPLDPTEQHASIMISAKGSISIISEKGEKLPINSMERVLTRQNGVFFFVLI